MSVWGSLEEPYWETHDTHPSHRVLRRYGRYSSHGKQRKGLRRVHHGCGLCSVWKERKRYELLLGSPEPPKQ